MFTVAGAGTIQAWDGRSWTDTSLKTAATFLGGWGTRGEAFAVGLSGAIARWGGTSWTSLSSGASPRNLFMAWAIGPDDVFAIEGRQPTLVPLSDGGQLVHWDGTSWTPVSLEGDEASMQCGAADRPICSPWAAWG